MLYSVTETVDIASRL